MSNAFLLPMQIFGIGFIISLLIACLIKVMLVVISRVTKTQEAEK